MDVLTEGEAAYWNWYNLKLTPEVTAIMDHYRGRRSSAGFA